MAHDVDEGHSRDPPKWKDTGPHDGRDLEVIVNVMEIAALILTSSPGQMFSFDDLFSTMRWLASPDIVFDEVDVRIVANTNKALIHKGGRYGLR